MSCTFCQDSLSVTVLQPYLTRDAVKSLIAARNFVTVPKHSVSCPVCQKLPCATLSDYLQRHCVTAEHKALINTLVFIWLTDHGYSFDSAQEIFDTGMFGLHAASLLTDWLDLFCRPDSQMRKDEIEAIQRRTAGKDILKPITQVVDKYALPDHDISDIPF